jgi:sugar (pentulose or hexulose) kinase
MISGDKANNKNLVIGLDCSTADTKAIAFDRKGKIAAAAHAPNPLFSPKPGYYEQHAQDCWNSARKALRTITGSVDPKRIATLAISNQRETFVPLNKYGRSIRPAIAAAVGAGWHGSFQEVANAMTGIRKIIKSDLGNHRKYQELFQIYKKLYPCFKRAQGRMHSRR